MFKKTKIDADGAYSEAQEMVNLGQYCVDREIPYHKILKILYSRWNLKKYMIYDKMGNIHINKDFIEYLTHLYELKEDGISPIMLDFLSDLETYKILKNFLQGIFCAGIITDVRGNICFYNSKFLELFGLHPDLLANSEWRIASSKRNIYDWDFLCFRDDKVIRVLPKRDHPVLKAIGLERVFQCICYYDLSGSFHKEDFIKLKYTACPLYEDMGLSLQRSNRGILRGALAVFDLTR
jgi:PAS domain-containing protein